MYRLIEQKEYWEMVLLGTVALGLLYLGVVIYRLLFSPMDVTRDCMDIGYIFDSRKDKMKQIKEMQSSRNVGDVPPVYPNGWFKLLDSSDLLLNSVKSIYALGNHFAVFRNSNGVVRIMDAYCPHLGANMSLGGRVVDSDCLQCPFHGWKFSGETGKCVDIPYSRKALKFISVKTYHVQEVNGIILVWHHCDGEAPKWENPKIPEIKRLKYVGKTLHVVYGHIQDIPENAADFSHLNHLHKPVLHRDITRYDSIMDIMQHDIKAKWERLDGKGNEHLSEMNICDNMYIALFKYRIPFKQLKFTVRQIGPGVVYLYMNTPWLRGIFIQTTTPIAPLKQKLSHVYYIDWKVPMFIAKLVFYFQAIQIDRDVVIWNNKTHLLNPAFVKEESAMAEYRRWFKQFYSKNSPRISDEETQPKDMSW